MKSAKKLLLLVLSLVLLVGVFTATAFAEESAQGLTVVYADGKTETFAAGAAVSGRSDVPTDFIQEVDGIAYKFTVAEGAAWSYAEDLPETVTADYYGKTITATIDGELGTAQVYYTTTVSNVTTYVTENNLGAYLKKWITALRSRCMPITPPRREPSPAAIRWIRTWVAMEKRTMLR